MLVRFSLIAAMLASSAAAHAQGTPQQRAACRPDVVKFCKGKGDDPGVLLTCLEDNKDKISDKCRVVIGANDTPAQKKGETPAPSAEKKDDKPAEKK
jgi:hypothetical protein